MAKWVNVKKNVDAHSAWGIKDREREKREGKEGNERTNKQTNKQKCEKTYLGFVLLAEEVSEETHISQTMETKEMSL